MDWINYINFRDYLTIVSPIIFSNETTRQGSYHYDNPALIII